MFKQRPEGMVEGTVRQLVISYDEYGIVALQSIDPESTDKKWVEVLKAALVSMAQEKHS